jgi:hypothetical protein
MPRLTPTTRDLATAITRVEDKFCIWPNSNRNPQAVERVFAYELYHQFRLLTGSDTIYAGLRLDGEITKFVPYHVDYCASIDRIDFNAENHFSPDLVLHLSQANSDSNNQRLIIEIKTSSSPTGLSRRDIAQDIIKLNHCVDYLRYQEAVFISVNTDYTSIAQKFYDMFSEDVCTRRSKFERIVIFNYDRGILHYQHLYSLVVERLPFVLFQQYQPDTASAQDVTFDNITMHVQLTDGRTLSVPLRWFPWLLAAPPEQRAQVTIINSGRILRWDELNEDLSVAGLFC